MTNNQLSPEELETIERFLTQQMPAEEATAFETSLSTNEQRQINTEDLRLILLGIQEEGLKDDLAQFHLTIPSASTPKKNAVVVPIARKLMAAAAILILLTTAAWWLLLRNNSNETVYAKYYTPDPGLATVMGGTDNYSFDKAMVEYKNGEYKKAIAAWTALLAAKPNNDTLTYFLGAAYQAENNTGQAINYLQRVANMPGSAFYKESCWYLGLGLIKNGHKKDAIPYLEKSAYPEAASLIKDIQ